MRPALLIVLLLAALDPAHALPSADRLALRYSNQVVFDRSGQPLVSIRLTESQRQVDFTAGGAIELLPGGEDDGRVQVPARSRWRVRVEAGQPARLQYWTVVGQFAAPEMGQVEVTRANWATGHEVEVLEGGALMGFAGRTLDTRVFTVIVDPKPTPEAARRHAKALAAEHGHPVRTVPALVDKPSGWIVAEEVNSGWTVRANDLLWLTPAGPEPVVFPRLEWGHGTPKRGRAKRSYAGDLYFTVGSDGLLAVVNVLPAERIIEGVVPSEIFPNAPPEALAAQSIAARGQVLAKVGTRHRADPYLLCAETHCQKYTGETRHDPRTTAAVRATHGLLLFADDGLVDTVYSSTCGGYREASHQMWQGPPRASLVGGLDRPGGAGTPVEDVARFIDRPPADAWCAAASRFRWTRNADLAAVTRGVKKHRDVGSVRRIEVTRRGHSGRALAVRYTGDSGQHVVRGSYRNRTLLGRLPSGMWVATPQGPADAPTSWAFRGGGFGHGVGLCQHGAISMAKAGRAHPEILAHYYPTSRLERAW